MILLNCLSEFGVEVMRQAADKGMTRSGWAWVVTDGMTASVKNTCSVFLIQKWC